MSHLFTDWHQQWLAAGSPPPAQKDASGIANVEVDFMPEQLQGSARVQFNAMITDGRRVSIRRVYGIKRA